MSKGVKSDFAGERFRIILQREFDRRRAVNRRYSLRAFARQLVVHPSTLSQMLGGKRKISPSTMMKVAKNLALSGDFLRQAEDGFLQIDFKSFENVSGWENFAVLEATGLDGFVADPESIAKLFDLSVPQATLVLSRLERFGFLHFDGKAYVRATAEFLTNDSDVRTSEAHKGLQRAVVAKAIEAIDDASQEEKDISSMTFAINESKLPEAREIIKECRRRLSLLLEQSPQTRVYHFGVQLYPVSKRYQRQFDPPNKEI